MCPRGARMLAGAGGLLEPARLVANCILVERADGLVLIDTGFGEADIRRPRDLGRVFNTIVRPRLDASETALAQVRALGFDAADVREIVTTHLDVDHAGGLPDFPHARVHVHTRELEAALHPPLRERSRYVATHWSHGPRWATHEAGGDEWLGFESVTVLEGPDADVLMIPLHGHTTGHCGVAVRDGERWLLHCGDAYFHHGEVQTPPRCPPGLAAFASLTQVDGAMRRSNRERLRELAARGGEPVTLLCAHDPWYFDGEGAVGLRHGRGAAPTGG